MRQAKGPVKETPYYHILIVDDDDRLRALLHQFLRENNFLVSTAKDASQARELLGIFDVDLIILDIMMPGEDGLSYLRSLRKTNLTPVLLLSAKWETHERIDGLEGGADDYLAKPFAPKELLLRLRSILRRMPAVQTPQMVAIGELSFDLQRGLLFHGVSPIPLSPTEQSLLKVLAKNFGRTLSREDLSALSDPPLNPRSIDVQVARLRRKIEPDATTPQFLQTIRHKGYILWGSAH